MIGFVRLLYRTVFSLACILLIIVLMSITWAAGARRATRAIMQAAFYISALVWNIRIRTQGTLAASRPLLLVSNHFSYLDLFVLGSRIPAAFTPKSEIRSWPLLGFMCKVSGCLFIDRRASHTLKNKERLEKALTAGDIISLFPEGTTSDGTMLLPFKSSFFSIAEETGTPIQPVSIIYTKLNGMKMTQGDLPFIGWYGDSYFFPHVAHFLRQQGVEATIILHPPVTPQSYASRKALARHCQTVIEKGMYNGAQVEHIKKALLDESRSAKPNNGG